MTAANPDDDGCLLSVPPTVHRFPDEFASFRQTHDLSSVPQMGLKGDRTPLGAAHARGVMGMVVGVRVVAVRLVMLTTARGYAVDKDC